MVHKPAAAFGRGAPGEAKPAPPTATSTAASSGHASLPPPVAAGQTLPIPMGPPAKAKPGMPPRRLCQHGDKYQQDCPCCVALCEYRGRVTAAGPLQLVSAPADGHSRTQVLIDTDYPVEANSAPGSSTPGAASPAKGWSGPLPGKRGPNLGGVLSPASVAPTVVTSLNPPVGGEGQSNCMRKCRP